MRTWPYRPFLTLVFLLTLVCTVINGYAGLSKDPVIAKNGQWSVRRSIDPMTDKVSYTALYKERFDVQVNETEFWFSLHGKGGIQIFSYRVDEDKAETRLPNTSEKQVGVAHLSGKDFARVLRGKRLRLSVLTHMCPLKRLP
jgi:hypothetical protein